ncbi:5-oxoprolinase subunit B family protein [Pseudooceanicola marinus]|uniref:5-oxoprolinase subunit B family protein n=1 Tax=Pseudooceanicola marinus TaxID=396013 RepID=UPI001CD7A68B|nr:carboxyltransferase domain-containing protein [Pseudooceanicola marinus]MCA1335048.1 allophanate hydrolase subunit 1 [Pseudooceanicola marinus]
MPAAARDPVALPALLPLGLDGVLVRFGTTFTEEANRAARAFAAEAAALDGVTEVVPAPASVLLRLDPLDQPADQVQGAARALLDSRDWLSLPPAPAARCWHLPVSFATAHAPDLPEVARITGLPEAEVVTRILAERPRVLAIGFAPGQPYLGQLPPVFDLPRRAQLQDVPAGALTLAIRQMVLFSNASPTGWMQIGRAAFRPFQPDATDPMPLCTGDEIRFHAVSDSELEALGADPMGGARLEVLS